MDRRKQAPANWSDALVDPAKWSTLYETFITKNAGSVSQIESTLRSLTYIIPGRFRDTEIASESLHSGLQLLSLYHDSLLARAVARLPAGIHNAHPTPHNRYTRFWTRRSPLYKRVALMLQMIRYIELLCEMAAKRRSEKARWRVVVLLEIVKALCRLVLLRLTNSRPLLSPPLPKRDIDPAALEEFSHLELDSQQSSMSNTKTRRLAADPSGTTHSMSDADSFEDDPEAESPSQRGWFMPRTGLTLPALPAATDITSYLLSKVLTAEDVKPPRALLHRVSGPGRLAEVLYILRPVIYALAMQRWHHSGTTTGGRPKKSWRPWLIGLSIEYGARQLAKRDFQERFAGGLRSLTGLEREELRRRALGLAWWAMRGAFYDAITKPSLEKVTSTLRKTPLNLLGGSLLSGIIDDYAYLWDEYHFSTSTL